MASRRTSSSRRPTSPDVTRPDQRAVSSAKHVEASNGAPGKIDGRKRSTSVTSFLNRFRPSHRPERGGTMRDHGFWGDQQDRQAADRPSSSHIALPSPRPHLRPRHGSDSIASSAWNQPIDLPRRTQTYQGRQEKLRSPPSASRPLSGTIFKKPPPSREQQQGQGQVQEYQTVTTHKAVRDKGAHAVEATTTTGQQTPDDGTTLQPTTVQDTFALFDQKREARRLRQSLKESSDFLGVQGVNPHTGVMDVITPTSSSPSDNTMRSLPELKPYFETMADFRRAYHRASRSQDAEEASLLLLRKEQERAARLQRHKDTIRAFQRRVRWQKEQHQWSSVAEPDLSPIVDLSVKSRSTSARGDTPPSQPVPSPQGIKRTYSNLPGLQTTPPAVTHTTIPPTSPPLDRPEIVARESSGTVIHTPVDNKTSDQRRFSVIAEILGNGNQPSSSPEAAGKASEPSESPGGFCPPSTEPRIRRKPIPSPAPTAQRSKLKLLIPDHKSYNDPPPVQAEHQGPFLGAQIESASASTHHFQNQATASSSTPVAARGLKKHPRCPQDPVYKQSRRSSNMSATVQFEDFADERNRQVAFHNHLSHLDRPATLPPVPVFGSTQDSNPGTIPQTKRKSLRLYRAPLVPRRLGSGAKTPENKSQKNTEAQSPGPQAQAHPMVVPPPTSSPNSMQIKSRPVSAGPLMSGAMTKEREPTSRWATQLIQDIEVPSRQPENVNSGDPSVNRNLPEVCPVTTTNPEVAESACTHTIITTGYEAKPLQNVESLLKGFFFDGPADNVSKDSPVTRTSTPPPDKITVQVTEKADEITEQGMEGIPDEVKEVTAAPLTKIARASTPSPQPPDTPIRPPSPPRPKSNVWPKFVIPPLPSHLRPVTAPAVSKPRSVSPRTASYPRPSTAPGQRPSGPGSGTTSSAHQLRFTRERYNRLCRRGSSLSRMDTITNMTSRATSSTEASRGRSRDRTSTKSDATMSGGRAASSMSTSIYQNPHSHSLTSSLVSLSGNNMSSTSLSNGMSRQRQPATEAARTALLAHPSPTKAKIVQVARKGSTASGKESAVMVAGREPRMGQGNMERKSKEEKGSKDGEEGTGDLSKSEEKGAKSFPLKEGKVEDKEEQSVSPSKRSVDLLVKFVVRYWTLVAPVFNTVSPISKRLSAHQSTLHDCMIYLLALAFVLAGFLLTVWTVKGIALIVRGIRAVGEGFGVLVGF